MYAHCRPACRLLPLVIYLFHGDGGAFLSSSAHTF
jgi:hypothetical protein